MLKAANDNKQFVILSENAPGLATGAPNILDVIAKPPRWWIHNEGFVSASYVHHRGTAVACNIMGSVGYSDKFVVGM